MSLLELKRVGPPLVGGPALAHALVVLCSTFDLRLHAVGRVRRAERLREVIGEPVDGSAAVSSLVQLRALVIGLARPPILRFGPKQHRSGAG